MRRRFSPLLFTAMLGYCTAGALAAESLTILWDDAHDFDGDELSAGYAHFAALIATEGHVMTELNGSPGALTPAALAGVDVLMVFDAELAFTAAEVTAVHDFVADGGKLFVAGETAAAFNRASHNELLGAFGLTFTSDTLVGDLTILAPDPLTTGLTGIDFTAGGALTLIAGPGTKVLAQTGDGKVGYASAVGAAVVVLADSNALDNTSSDASPFALGANEAQLVRNLLGHFQAPAALEITIDIKPRDDGNELEAPSPINPKSRGVVPVALLTMAMADGDALDFDPWEVIDPTTLRLGPGAAQIDDTQPAAEDVDADGDLDMLVHFGVPESRVVCGMTELTLVGSTFDGGAIVGTDAIVTPGCK